MKWQFRDLTLWGIGFPSYCLVVGNVMSAIQLGKEEMIYDIWNLGFADLS